MAPSLELLLGHLARGPSGAVLSRDRRYRYLLWRQWGDARRLVLFVGLNPSTADENDDDPTIRRCRAFAESWGYAGFMMANLFALRATEPAVMKQDAAPVGRLNDRWLRTASELAACTVACWGNHGSHRARDAAVLPMLKDPTFLRLTGSGQPAHPLYLPGGLLPSRDWV